MRRTPFPGRRAPSLGKTPKAESPFGQTSANRGVALAQKSPLPLLVPSSEPRIRGGGSAAGKPRFSGWDPQSRSPPARPSSREGGGGGGAGARNPLSRAGPPFQLCFPRTPPCQRVTKAEKSLLRTDPLSAGRPGGQVDPFPAHQPWSREGGLCPVGRPGHSSIQPGSLRSRLGSPGGLPGRAPLLPQLFSRTWHLGKGQGQHTHLPPQSYIAPPPCLRTREGSKLTRAPGLGWGWRSHGYGRPPRAVPRGERGSRSERVAGGPGGQ